MVSSSRNLDDAMDLQTLRNFVSVVHAGSFAAAARATGVPKSTLSKRVQDLETSLSLRLVERTTRKLRLTPDGTVLFERAFQLIADADDLEQLMRVRDERPRCVFPFQSFSAKPSWAR